MKIFFFKTIFIFNTFVISFTKILLFADIAVKLLKVRNDLLDEINPQWYCFISKNKCLGRTFMGNREAYKFFNTKRIWKA